MFGVLQEATARTKALLLLSVAQLYTSVSFHLGLKLRTTYRSIAFTVQISTSGRMTHKEPLRPDGVGNDNPSVKRIRRRRAGPTLTGNLKKYSTLIVRIGQHSTEFPFFLVSLLNQSTYFRRLIVLEEAKFNKEGHNAESPLEIDLPDFPYSLEVFKIIQDFCSAGMEDDDISIENAVDLFYASQFLEMEYLTCLVLNFINERVFNSFESCLSLLTTFDCNHLHALDNEDGLFERCKKAILCKIGVNLSIPTKRAAGYNVKYLLRISDMLSKPVVDRIYRYFWLQLSNFDFIFFFEKPACSEGSVDKDVICSVFCTHLVERDPPDHHWSPGDLINGLERIPWPPGGSQRWTSKEIFSEVTSHCNTMMSLERCIKDFANGMSSSEPQKLQLSFICLQLVHSSEVYWYDVFEDISRRKEIPYQERLELLKLLDSNDVEFSKHNLKKLFEELHVDCGPRHFKKILEMQREEHIVKTKNSLQVADLRTELRQAMTDKQVVKSKLDKSIQESQKMELDLRTELKQAMTDKQMLKSKLGKSIQENQKMELAKISERAETDKQVADLQGRLSVKTAELMSVIETQGLIKADRDSLNELKRLAESERDALRAETATLQGKLSVKTEELMSVIETKRLIEVDRDSLSGLKQLAESERDALRAETATLQGKLSVKTEELMSVIETTRLTEADRDSLSELKRLAESERDALNERKKVVESKLEKLLLDLEEEKEKITCQICFVRPRNSLCWPCGHFLYCSECLAKHHKRTKTCPTCRCPAGLALTCNLWV